MDTFNLYLDNPRLFECSVGLEGVSYRDASARIVAITDDINLLFNGTMTGQGECSILIPAVCGLFDDGMTGTLRLEVIADGYYFNALEMPFVAGYAKKVSVTNINQTNVVEEAPTVSIAEPPQFDDEPVAVPVIEPVPMRKATVKRKPIITDDVASAIIKGMTAK